jgi:primosomal protein N' (replication factor Y)
MPVFVEVVVNIPQVSGTYDYHVPPGLEDQVQVGCLVSVPFGSRTVQGVVIRRMDKAGVAETRPVIELVDPVAILTEHQIWLAHWLAETTLSPLASFIGLMLPPGVAQQADMLYTLVPSEVEQLGFQPTNTQTQLIHLLRKRGPLRGGQIDAAMPRRDWRPAARFLARKGMLTMRSVLPVPRIQPKFVKTARLAVPPEQAEKALSTLAQPLRRIQLADKGQESETSNLAIGRPGSAALARRQAILRYLHESKAAIDVQDLYAATHSNKADLDRLIHLGLVEVIEVNSPALERRQAMLRYLMREPGEIEVHWLYAESGGSLEDLYALEERGLVILGESEFFRDPLQQTEIMISQPLALTQDQQIVWQRIRGSIEQSLAGEVPPAMLLHGVTGSGKTEIYLQAVQAVLEAGRQAIVLVPEIALTPQTIRRFIGRFPGKVGLMHSGLSGGERYDTWRRARAGSLSVVIGPRSALFTPFANLGLIIVDECHDDSYYQADIKPHYQAVQAALACCARAAAVCLLGSATPDVVSYAQAIHGMSLYSGAQFPSSSSKDEIGRWRPGKEETSPGKESAPLVYLRLPNRILAHRDVVRAQLEYLELKEGLSSGYRRYEADSESIELPEVQIVDMRQELRNGNRSIFSQVLQDHLGQVLDRHQQAILFLNRRGTATYVFCRNCGLILKCPQCELPLIYHQLGAEPVVENPASLTPSGSRKSMSARLTCHHCGYERGLPEKCPQCKSPHIRQYGTGTERVVDEVQKFYPQARILRWDWETTRQKGAHEMILSHFLAHRADVLVGTQMLAKGLDLPLVTLVGVVIADVGLALPDYRANERTFQVLMQVAGRAGRSPLGGRVILQTFQPDHYVIQAAAAHDYATFAAMELEYRKKLGYPPYLQIVRLEYRHPDLEQAEAAGNKMAAQLKTWLAQEDRRATSLAGPYPPFFARISGQYRIHIILRGPDPVSLFYPKDRLSLFSDWHIEVNPPSLL